MGASKEFKCEYLFTFYLPKLWRLSNKESKSGILNGLGLILSRNMRRLWAFKFAQDSIKVESDFVLSLLKVAHAGTMMARWWNEMKLEDYQQL